MTESEWLECTSPDTRLWAFYLPEHLAGHLPMSERKKRLFVVGCCRRIWAVLDQQGRHAVEVAERLADGHASPEEWEAAQRPVAERGWDKEGVNVLDYPSAAASMSGCGYDYFETPRLAARACGNPVEMFTQVALVRCIMSNPFRPASINPTWLTPAVTNLAQSAYDERAMPSGELEPARLAVLSDALEEAGCDNEDILNHLRSPGSHVRGCWALDLILGKS